MLINIINKSLVSSLVLFSITTFAVGESEYLKEFEIKKLMTGNSISGVWQGNIFKQNNHVDGIAVVNIKGSKINNIPWVVNERNEYCENWGSWGWSCYKFKKTTNEKILAVKVGSDKQNEVTWNWHPGFIDINL
jgi:hypothetical protein